MTEAKLEKSELRTIKRLLWLLAALIVLVAVSFVGFFSTTCFKEKQELRNLILSLTDTLNTTRNQTHTLDIAIVKNKKIEDSLETRIDIALDSLEIYEKKLRVMQNNSRISIEVIVSILDSVDYYRNEVANMKREIERINNENAKLLQIVSDNNAFLNERIKAYEKRLMVIYAINMKFTSFRDGYDQNDKLIETKKASKVKEFFIEFKLTRDLQKEDKITIEIIKNNQAIFSKEKTDIKKREIKESFIVTKGMGLSNGIYFLVIHHQNEEYEISPVEIGRLYIELE